MKTDILTPKTLFQQEVRYTIPLFQRPYVWTQDEQWGPLWDDVQNVAESYLEELERCGGILLRRNALLRLTSLVQSWYNKCPRLPET